MKEALVRVKDGKLSYVFEGQGDPLILLHSLGLSKDSWRYVIEPLSQKFAVYAIDLMGHGDSDKPSKNYEINHFAENIIQFMDVLGIRQARVIGNSIGAMISIEMAASSPYRILKQVLVGCPAWETAWERVENLMFFAHRYDTQGNPRPVTMDDLSRTYVHVTPELLKWHNALRVRSGIWCKKGHISITLWDIIPKLKLVSCPTLIIFGSKDFLRENEQVLIKGITGAKHALIEDAAHLPQMDAPEAFIKSVTKFL